MDRALVIYESMFGNTRTIAEAVGEGLADRFATQVVEVGEAPTSIDGGITLLVVGGPTHSFGLTRASTREDAAGRAEGRIVSARIGLREWLGAIARSQIGAATFDTRIDRPRVPGSAAKGAEKRLRRLGFHIVAPAESFYVNGTEGPLVAGEAGRAGRWAAELLPLPSTVR